MSKELADRLEQLADDLHSQAMIDADEVLIMREAIAALRSEPVAEIELSGGMLGVNFTDIDWKLKATDGTKLYAAPSRETDQRTAPAQDSEVMMPVAPSAVHPKPAPWILKPTDDTGMLIPSRETAKVVPVHSKSQYRRVAAQGGNPVLSRDTAKPEAAPALSAEQFSERDIEYWRRQLLSIEWSSPKTDHLHINTICNMALSSLTARDDGIEAAAKLADANGALQIRWFAEDIRKLKGASHD